MGYNSENYRKIRAEFGKKSMLARTSAEEKKAELDRLFPDIAEIDDTLSKTSVRIFGEAVKGGGDLEKRISKLQKEVEELSNIRADLLKEHGYPEDYDKVHYECEKCEDTGFCGTKMCECMRRELILAGYESSGIGNLLKTQSFETFDLGFYSGNAEDLKCAKQNFDICRKFADGFEIGKGENLFLFGGTGLGKTHLSTSVAKVLIDRGFDVLYVTAHALFSDFEKDRFGKEKVDIDRYFSCDLLIIDDLGTEAANRFTVSSLYNLVNTRMLKQNSTMINTNLTHEELLGVYSDRIVSRILGNYTQLKFSGKDIRMQKLAADSKKPLR